MFYNMKGIIWKSYMKINYLLILLASNYYVLESEELTLQKERKRSQHHPWLVWLNWLERHLIHNKVVCGFHPQSGHIHTLLV